MLSPPPRRRRRRCRRPPSRFARRARRTFGGPLLRVRLAAAARVLGHAEFLVDAHDQLADDEVAHLEAAVEFFGQLAGAVEHFEDVRALAVFADAVRQLAAAPVLGPDHLALQAGDDGLDLRVQVGDVLIGRVWRHDIDEFVLSGLTHAAPSGHAGHPDIGVARSQEAGASHLLNRFMAASTPSAMKHSTASAARATLSIHGGGFVVIEPRQHVIRQLAAWIAAADTNSESRELLGPEEPDDRPEPVVPAGRAPRAQAQAPQRQVHVVGHHEDVRRFDLEEVRQPGHRLAAQIHHRERLDDAAPPTVPSRPGPSGRSRGRARTSPRGGGPVRRPRRTRYCAASRDSGVRDCRGQRSASLLLLLVFLVTLLGLALLDDFGLGRRRRRRHGGGGIGRGFATAARGATMCTSMMSGSVTGFQRGSVATSRRRTAWPSISSVMSISMCSGMSAGRHSMSTSRCTKSSEAALLLHALGLALDRDRHLDGQQLVHRDAVEVHVEELAA